MPHPIVRTQQHRFDSFSYFGCAGRGVLSNFGTTATRGENFAGIQKTIGVEYTLDAHHRIQVGFVKNKSHKVLLFVTNPVLSAQGTTHIDTQLHDLFAHCENLIDMIRIPAVKQDERMKVTISRMEYVRDTKPITFRHAVDLEKHFG